MVTGPGHEMEPPSQGHLRSSYADRERAIDVLKAAFAEGRLDQDEYNERVSHVYSSRTYAELAALTADLPVGPLGALAAPNPSLSMLPQHLGRPSPPARRRRRRHPVLAMVVIAWMATVFAANPAALGVLPVILFAVIICSRFLYR